MPNETSSSQELLEALPLRRGETAVDQAPGVVRRERVEIPLRLERAVQPDLRRNTGGDVHVRSAPLGGAREQRGQGRRLGHRTVSRVTSSIDVTPRAIFRSPL